MELDRFLENVNNISELSDLPNTEEGLTSAELKARFDKAGSDIKYFLNNIHIPQLELYEPHAFTVTFPANATRYTCQTPEAHNVTSSTHVFCQPQKASQALWNKHGVKCSAVSLGELTFTAQTAPSSAVKIDVLLAN